MKKFYIFTVAVMIAGRGAIRAQEASSIPRGALGSGANIGQLLGDRGITRTPSNSPFTNGLGQQVKGWTQQGIHGPESADRIHWLQSTHAEQNPERTRGMEQRRFDPDRNRDDRFRDRDDRFREHDRETGLRDRDRDDRFHDRNRDERSRDRDRDRDRDERSRDRDRDRNRDERSRDRDRDERSRDRDRDRDDRSRDRDRDRNRDERGARDHDARHDRDEHGMRDHDPRRDRDDRRRERDNSAMRDRDVQGSHNPGHDHGAAKKDDFGKQTGAQGSRQDNHTALNATKKSDSQKPISNVKHDHSPNVPSPNMSKTVAHPGKGKGK
jgi:hypothetical protein